MGGKAYLSHYAHVHFLRKTVVYSKTSAQTVGYMPNGALTLLDELANGAFVTTAFNDGGSDLLDIGHAAYTDSSGSAVSADPDDLATDLNVATTGWKPVDEAATSDQIWDADSDGVPITATYAGASGDATAGSAEVIISYIPDKQSPYSS